MRGVVACPEEHIWLYLIAHIGEHALKSYRRKITLVSSKLSCLLFRISWETIDFAAAKEAATVLVCALSVLEVYMRITDLDSFKGLAWLWALCNLVIYSI